MNETERHIGTLNQMQSHYSHIRHNDNEFLALEASKEALREKAERDTEAKRRRTEGNPQPLTLAELREMDGEPVWIVENGKTECGVVSLEGNCFEKEPTITMADGNFYLLEEYNGKTWLAYRTRPEGSGE